MLGYSLYEQSLFCTGISEIAQNFYKPILLKKNGGGIQERKIKKENEGLSWK